MRVLISSRDYLPDYGGVQIYMERLAHYYGEKAVVVTRHCPGDESFDRDQPYTIKRMPRLEWRHGNRVIGAVLRVFSYIARFIISGIYLADAIRDQKTDVVYCAYPFPNGLPMMVVRILTGCPYVVFVHGSEVLREREAGGIRLLALRVVLRLALRVVATGEFMAEIVGHYVDRRRVIVTPLGADSGPLDADTPPLEEIGGVDLRGKQVILTVGRVEKRKGHDNIVKALPAIFESRPEAVWVIVGDGPERAHIEKEVAGSPWRDRVIFTGRLSYAELAGAYARADLFLLPNRQVGYDVEGFGIVFLEAAMFGTPCVAGNSGGAPQAIDEGRTGLLCDGDDPADIAAKVVTILSDEAKARAMGEAGRKWVEKHTWAACAQTIESVVKPLVS